ncbi:MAG: metallophosphoesterase [Candidatus Micrarchaeaceae archaeon]
MNIGKDLLMIEGLPILYVRSLKMLVCADLHLGYEGVMSNNGLFLPKANLKSIKSSLEQALQAVAAKRLLVDGDIKNEFSGVDVEEFNELYEFINFVSEIGLQLTLIKGNHDNFVERYKKAFKFRVYRQQHAEGSYLFFHGEEMPRGLDRGIKTIIMGHEHPAISIYTPVGKAEKIKSFLIGSYKGRKLIVLPAMSYYSPGTSVNIEPSGEMLSPIFKHVSVDSMEAIAVGYGSTISFGTVGMLRRLAIRHT